MNQTRVDTMTMVAVINHCFDLAMDARVPLADQANYLAAGKRLRGYLLNLLTARFEVGTPELSAANTALTTVNKDLKNAANQLARTAQLMGDLAQLVSLLDDLLKAASAFV